MKKNSTFDLQSISYTPDIFIELLIKTMVLKNDAALSRRLEVAPPVISKIRHSQLPIGASLILRAHEESGLSIRTLKAAAGLQTLHPISVAAAENESNQPAIKSSQEHISNAFAIPACFINKQSSAGAGAGAE